MLSKIHIFLSSDGIEREIEKRGETREETREESAWLCARRPEWGNRCYTAHKDASVVCDAFECINETDYKPILHWILFDSIAFDASHGQRCHHCSHWQQWQTCYAWALFNVASAVPIAALHMSVTSAANCDHHYSGREASVGSVCVSDSESLFGDSPVWSLSVSPITDSHLLLCLTYILDRCVLCVLCVHCARHHWSDATVELNCEAVNNIWIICEPKTKVWLWLSTFSRSQWPTDHNC